MEIGMKMKSLAYLVILPASLMLLACSPDNSAKTKLFEEQRAALEKAKGVENSVMQQTQETQQNVEKQTQ
jgi:hypothetical protein